MNLPSGPVNALFAFGCVVAMRRKMGQAGLGADNKVEKCTLILMRLN
jgi:hypothetical protein